jgi:hypothetical protein
VLELDPTTHVYTDRGRPVSGVTDILHLAGLCDAMSFQDHARWRGSQVHKACQYYDERDLDQRTLPREIAGYLRGWIKFRAENFCVVLGMEERVRERRYGYAGTLDRRVRFARGPFKGRQSILDIKTNTGGEVAPMARVQMAGYGYAKRKGYLWPRLAICLRPDGTYAIETYGPETFTEDLHDFLAAHRTARWRQSHLGAKPND